MKYSIKFRPVKPGSPHLNGKVERSQQTDLREFYANTDLSNFETLKNQLAETKRQNDALQEELQTKITSMESSSSNNF